MILDRRTSRLCVVMPTWVGDIVMATPALRLLRSHLPEATITAAVRPGLAPLLDGLDDLDECVDIRPGGSLGPIRAGRRIARTRPEAIVLLPNSMRSALVARFSGARIRAGFRRQGRRLLLSHAITPPEHGQVHTTLEDYVALAAALVDQPVPGPEACRPRLVVTEADRRAVSVDLDAGDFVVLVPGANRVDKRWPAEHFARLADILAHDHGVRVFITGAPAEQALVREIAEATSCPVTDLAAAGMGLGGLKAVLAAASLVISNDTGPRHIAAAVGTPIVSLFGPTDHRWTVLPGVVEHRLLAEPFLPESMLADRCTRVCHIDRITVGDVHAAAAALLAASDGQPAAAPCD
ncbi:MAG: lipopolysaccharide heptosyltransferase II [Phycisphaerales bacterium]|nr:lipopolysaccharide heptosyltransferase II [Phycisphaerales bacterium]